nr:hypothetical protein [Tanacetum cinerariifolium]
MMSEILDDAIVIYHRMFDLSGVRIPFCTFLLALIKHYRVHFSQMGPLVLNKEINFKVLCRSLQIEPTHWKSRFFLIDRRAILDSMIWRHLSGAIDDPRPAAGSFSMADVHRLSAHVIKLRDMTEFALAQSSSSTTRPSLFMDNSDDRSNDDDAYVEIPLVTPIRSAAVIPSSGNQGRSSTAPATKGPGTRDSRGKGIMADDAVVPSVGVSRPRPSSGPAPSFKDISGDAIHTDFFPFSAGPYYATYPEGGVARNCEFTREEWDAPYWPTFGVLTKEVFKDPVVCKTVVDQFPTPGEMVRVEIFFDDQLTTKLSVLHCMMMSHDGKLLAYYRGLNQSHHEYVLLVDSRAKGKERKKKIKSLTKSLDNLHAEVVHLSADLNQAIVLEAEKDEEILRLKATPLVFSSFFRGQLQGLVWKFLAFDEFSRVQGELLSLAASAGFERGLSMHQTKDEFAVGLKKMAHFISEFFTEPLSVILQLEPEKLVRPTNVPTSRDARVSPPIAKELTVAPTFKSLELSANVFPTPSVIDSEQNEEWVNAMFDGMDVEITDGDAHSKLMSLLDSLDHWSGRVSSGLINVVVALFTSEKVMVPFPLPLPMKRLLLTLMRFKLSFSFPPFFVSLFSIRGRARADPESCHPPYAESLPPGTFSIASQASVGSMG